MSTPEKRHSIVPKLKTALLTLAVLWAVSLAFSVLLLIGVLPREDDSRMAKAIVWLFPFVTVFFPAAMAFVPFSYSRTPGGVRFHAFARTKTVLFENVESVVQYRHKVGSGLQDRVLIVSGGRDHFIVGDATDFEEIRDYVLSGVDPSLVVDRREPAGGA